MFCLTLLTSCSTQPVAENYSSPVLSQDLLDDAYNKYLAGDYYDALQIIKPLAHNNNPKAQFFLGAFYADGVYVGQSYSTAAYWYYKSAEQGLDTAQFDLGNLYHKGNGVSQSYSTAVYWYKKAANQGEARAQSTLAIMYIEGHGVEKNLKKSVNWFTKSAQQGNASAQYSLGMSYYLGRGVRQDFQQAKYWLTKAKNNNDTSSSRYATLQLNKIENMSWLEKSSSNWWDKQKKGASSVWELITEE